MPEMQEQFQALPWMACTPATQEQLQVFPRNAVVCNAAAVAGVALAWSPAMKVWLQALQRIETCNAEVGAVVAVQQNRL